MHGHPLAKRGAPHGHLPPFGRPTGGYGHRLPHWPPTGHLLAIRGGPDWPPDGGSLRPALPRLAKGTGGGAYGHTGAPAPHFPATYGQRGATPPTGHKGAAIGGRPSHLPSLATYSPSPHRPIEGFGRDGQKQGSPPYTDLLTGHLLATYGQRGHTTHWPPTGHLRPTWPSEAFGHLLPPHRPIEAFGRGGAKKQAPHSPDFRERWPKGGGGGFRVQRGPIRWCPCALYPLWGPLPPPTYPTGTLRAPASPLPTGTYPPSPTDWPKGGGLATYGLRGAGFFSALTPTTLLEWGDVLLGLLL